MVRRTLITCALMVLAICPTAYSQSLAGAHTGASGSDGILRPWKEADAATTETGLVHKLLVKVGDVVTVGQPIAELDSQSLKIQLETARAQASAEGRLMTAKAEVELHQRRVKSIEGMRQRNQANEMELDKARVDLQMAQGRLQGEIEDRRVLQLQVARLEEQLSERIVKAPISGVVVKLHKEVGEFVAANSPQVARIADVTRMKAMFYLTDSEARTLPKDKTIRVRVSNGSLLNAAFDYVLPYANDESGLIEMQVIIDNPKSEVMGSRCQLVLPGPSA